MTRDPFDAPAPAENLPTKAADVAALALSEAAIVGPAPTFWATVTCAGWFLLFVNRPWESYETILWKNMHLPTICDKDMSKVPGRSTPSAPSHRSIPTFLTPDIIAKFNKGSVDDRMYLLGWFEFTDASHTKTTTFCAYTVKFQFGMPRCKNPEYNRAGVFKSAK